MKSLQSSMSSFSCDELKTKESAQKWQQGHCYHYKSCTLSCDQRSLVTVHWTTVCHLGKPNTIEDCCIGLCFITILLDDRKLTLTLTFV